jgi:Arc/MetJ family transcription regulator
MTKTLVDIDDDRLEAAKAALGTTTKVDTVNRALAEVAALAARRRDLARWADDHLPDSREGQVDDEAWR